MKSLILAVALVLAMAAIAAAQAGSTSGGTSQCVPMAQPPSTPHVTSDVLPGEGWPHGGTRSVLRSLPVFDNWNDSRRQVGSLVVGQLVRVVSGINVVEKPDSIRAIQPIPWLHVAPGDKMLRYAELGEGVAQIWANGCWYRTLDASFISDANRTGCRHQCKAEEIQAGTREWWFQLALPGGRRVWVGKDFATWSEEASGKP